ncbi:hypothetical protein NP493_1054g00016 [Ridgeia piscesae]|uniref:Uncharacterized protein n=1 Tax=Ridgeia piscesae TaxID=27915 RepID=A0AAD9KHN9_RIDPI|nr:hypothetical protein NP493_1054g00016 [Ridgeia piscesae]
MGHKSTARIWGGAWHEDTTAPSHPLNTNCHEDSTDRAECGCDSVQTCPRITSIVPGDC